MLPGFIFGAIDAENRVRTGRNLIDQVEDEGPTCGQWQTLMGAGALRLAINRERVAQLLYAGQDFQSSLFRYFGSGHTVEHEGNG